MDLYPRLKPNDPRSEVDKVVAFILKENIPIRYLNAAFTLKALQQNLKFICDVCQLFKSKWFTSGENEIISRSWNRLVNDAGVNDPSKCIEDFFDSSRVSLFFFNMCRLVLIS